MNDNNNINSQYSREIIKECIKLSYQTENITNNSPGVKSKLSNLKNKIKYNVINSGFNKNKFIWQNDGSPVFVFHKKCTEKEKYNEKIKKLLLMTYRENYKKQVSIKNKSFYTSDCGWGCMIRSSQMLFSRMLYKIFKQQFKKYFNCDISIECIIPFFLDNNIDISENMIKTSDYFNIVIQDYIKQLNLFCNEKANEDNKLIIKSIDPPFSIHKICMIGEIFGRTCGEWFSDYELPKIYEIINSTFNIIPNLSIIHFHSEIDMKVIIEKCFEKEENIIEKDEFSNDKENNYFTNEKNEKYIFKKCCGIFVSVRLGVTEIPSEYLKSIKNLFKCKQFLGIIGGKINSASYFFGCQDNDLLFLDPHFTQESINDLDEKDLMTYINKTVYKLPLKNLQCGFTIGFLIRNYSEFQDLYTFFKEYIIDKFHCFHVFFENDNNNNTLTQEEINKNINNNDDDF